MNDIEEPKFCAGCRRPLGRGESATERHGMNWPWTRTRNIRRAVDLIVGLKKQLADEQARADNYRRTIAYGTPGELRYWRELIRREQGLVAALGSTIEQAQYETPSSPTTQER